MQYTLYNVQVQCFTNIVLLIKVENNSHSNFGATNSLSRFFNCKKAVFLTTIKVFCKFSRNYYRHAPLAMTASAQLKSKIVFFLKVGIIQSLLHLQQKKIASLPDWTSLAVQIEHTVSLYRQNRTTRSCYEIVLAKTLLILIWLLFFELNFS